MGISKRNARLWRHFGKVAAALAALFFLGVVGVQYAQAQTESIIYNFPSSTSMGEVPYAGLVMDSAGNLYGTTSEGGLYGDGTVFELVKSSGTYTESVLYSFKGSADGDGATPYGGLLMDSAGNLYGTTYGGGTSTNCGTTGCGTIFELVYDSSTNSYAENILHNFTGTTNGDGANPWGSLVMDSKGDLYSTTLYGGASGYGTVFELVKSSGYSETVLHSFTDASGDGAYPYAGLVMDSASGNLYGTTSRGGASGNGTVFEVNASGLYSALYSFKGGSEGDGEFPYARLIVGPSGNLYGTTSAGGTSGSGTVFKITTSGNETVLYSFSSTHGAIPRGGLVTDSAGNLYGTTLGGGSGYGTVFELVNSSGTYKEKVLHSFTNSNSDGLFPYAGLLEGTAGNLYGTTLYGGSGYVGTVYEVALSIPFSAFSAKLDITADQFQLNGAFTLGNGATAINPVTQSTKLTVGTYTVTIPAGSFIAQSNGNFSYQGTINGVPLTVEIAPTGADAYDIRVDAMDVNLTTLSNPVEVTLGIGNNTGTTQVTAQF